MLRVTVVRGGGLAGTVVTTTLDAAALDGPDADRLRALVDACAWADRPPTGRPDGVRVEVAVDDGGATVRARFDEHDPPAGTAALLAWLADHPASRRSVGRG